MRPLRLSRDAIAHGTFVKTDSSHTIELLGTAGLDFAVIDAEHAPFDRLALDRLLLAGRAADLPLLVRLPDKAAASVQAVLDMGAAGILVPHVDSAPQAREVVACAKFHGGHRGFSLSPRYAGYGTLTRAQAIEQGDATRIVCQIESADALAAVDAIAAVPGVDALFIGRADLALSMGLEAGAEALALAVSRIVAAAGAAGKVCGMYVADVAEVARFAAQGVSWFIISSDQGLLQKAAMAISRKLPSEVAPAPAAAPGAMLACVSHAPLILVRARVPPAEAEITARAEAFRQALERFEPEQVIFFGNDHFAGFHYANMPPFCVGTEAESVPDLGGFEGRLQVPAAGAVRLVEHLRDEGFDPAISYRMRVDHAFSQPLQRLLGGLARWPVIPIFINVFTPPFMRFGRSRRLGEAVGRFAMRSGKRTLVLGTGGLSHHPAHYFPLLGTAPPDVHGYQMEGARGGTLSDAQWFERFERMHLDGARALAHGERTEADIRLNTALDRQVLAHLQAGQTEAFDGWDPAQLVEQAGVGMLEIHTWIAATAAFRQIDGQAAIDTYYAPVVEYGGGYGMLQSRLGNLPPAAG